MLEAAKMGLQATGYELNPWLVWYSKLTARLQGLHHNAAFYRRDLWKVDLTRYDSAVVFGVPQMVRFFNPIEDLEGSRHDKKSCIAFIFLACTRNEPFGAGVVKQNLQTNIHSTQRTFFKLQPLWAFILNVVVVA